MSRVLIESLWCVNPYLNSTAFIQFTLIFASSIATNNNHSLKIGKSFYDKIFINDYLSNNLNKTLYIFSSVKYVVVQQVYIESSVIYTQIPAIIFLLVVQILQAVLQ